MYRTLALAGMGMLLIPQVGAATDVESEIRQVQERLSAIEQQLEVTNEELADANATVAAQQATIEAAGLDERDGSSGISSFIEATDIAAWVATSYNYNFKGTGATNMATGGGNCGGTLVTGPTGLGRDPGYCNPNTFQLDQAWISIDKAPTSESRAGFHMEFSAGQVTSNGINDPTSNANELNIETAYVSYLAPVLEGLQFDVGKQWTMLGGEVLATNANMNITRGQVWGLQPVTTTGLVAHLSVTEALRVSAGVTNETVSDPTWDTNAAKSLTSQVAYSAEKFSGSVGVNYGRDNGVGSERLLLVDVLFSVDPLDNLSAWINYDFRKDEPSGGGADIKTNGIAIASRLGVLDETGIALRFEWVKAESSDNTMDNKLITLTGTIDQALTDNLDLVAEVRWDQTDPDSLRNNNGNTVTDSQVVGLLQMVYSF